MQPLEMALETALLVMRNGGSTVAAERCFTNILKGYHQEGVEAVWRLDFVAATHGVEGRSASVVRSVGPIGTNLVRASEAAVLGERVAKGGVDLAVLGAEVQRIRQLPASHNRWMRVLIAACTAAFFSQILGGDWGSFGIAFVAGGVGQLVRSMLQARKLAAAPEMLLCGVLSALIAAVGLRMGFSQAEPVTLLSSVSYTFPGLPLINGFADVLSHRHLVVGIERIMNAAYLFLILAIAIAFASTVAL